MATQNKVILVGRLTADPETRSTNEGSSLSKYTLAIDRPFTNNQKTDFIPIICWGRLAEQASKYFKKGMLALVEGRISVRSYEDKNGDNVWVTEVVANFMRMLSQGGGKEKVSQTKSADDETEEDIPF